VERKTGKCGKGIEGKMKGDRGKDERGQREI